ncbi:MAG: KH domain-containing protein [Pyrinomonadaceae bacterium]|nr:KH domain-containing protein [Pyrinomonadaceae bacterium]
MREAIEKLVKALVDNSDAVTVEESSERSATTLKVRVDNADMGRLIGREGKTIKALRSLIHAAGQKNGQRIQLEIVE